jgi:hypothetical protein
MSLHGADNQKNNSITLIAVKTSNAHHMFLREQVSHPYIHQIQGFQFIMRPMALKSEVGRLAALSWKTNHNSSSSMVYIKQVCKQQKQLILAHRKSSCCSGGTCTQLESRSVVYN